MGIRLIERWEDCQVLAREWNALAQPDSGDVLDRDVTSTFEWACAIWDALRDDQCLKVLVLKRDDRVTAVLPLVRSVRRHLFIKSGTLQTITQLNGGRTGFLLTRSEDLDELFEYLFRHLRDWDALLLNLVEGSISEHRLLDVLSSHGYIGRRLATERSPLIRLPDTWDAYFDSLPKKFRWTIRSSRRRLEERGDLSYRAVHRPEEVRDFLDSMWEIERNSWKEAAGSSITTDERQQRFYEAFVPLAAKRGWLSGHLLAFDGVCIAYVLGLEYANVFYDLKESFNASYRADSPSHVLKSFLFPELIRGNLHTYDFMGRCEDYKMRWTNLTYGNSSFIIYNRTAKARYLRIKSWLGTKSRTSRRVTGNGA